MTARVREFLGLKRNIILLLLAMTLIGLGEEMWMRFLPKYLQSLGAGLFVIGLFDALKTLLGALYAYPGGIAVDRWGHRRALMVFNLLSILGCGLVLVVPHWGAVIAGMFLFLAWSCFSLPATFSLIGASLPADKHTMGVGVQSLIKRLPILLGPVAGGILIDHRGVVEGVRLALAVSIGLALFAMLAQRRIEEDCERGGGAPSPSHGFLRLVREFSPELKHLLLSDILIRFCERIPYAWVVIYAMDHVGVSATQVGILTAVEMLTAILCFIPTSWLADRYGKEPFVVATFIFFTLFPIMLWFSHSYLFLILAFVVRGFKEFGDPARKALIISYAPAASRGRVIGAYYLIRDAAVTAGAFLGAWLWQFGPGMNFLCAAAVGALGAIFYVATPGMKTCKIISRREEPFQKR